ncbi:hypothetical protein BDQ17DRAFT_1175769, partial [Cyathus striatus]
DNVFLSDSLMEDLIVCTTIPALSPPKVDHFPVFTKLLALAEDTPVHLHRNFKAVDWKKFWDALADQMSGSAPAHECVSWEDFDMCLRSITDAITSTIANTVPMAQISPHTKHWWNTELANLQKEKVHLGHASHCHTHTPRHPSHEEYCLARNIYAEQMQEAWVVKWTDYLEKFTDSTIWDIDSFLSSSGID